MQAGEEKSVEDVDSRASKHLQHINIQVDGIIIELTNSKHTETFSRREVVRQWLLVIFPFDSIWDLSQEMGC